MFIASSLLAASLVAVANAAPTVTWSSGATSPVQCQNVSVDWTSDTGLTAASMIVESVTAFIMSIPVSAGVTSGTFNFVVEVPETLQMAVEVIDSSGNAKTSYLAVGNGTSTSCLSAEGLVLYSSLGLTASASTASSGSASSASGAGSVTSAASASSGASSGSNSSAASDSSTASGSSAATSTGDATVNSTAVASATVSKSSSSGSGSSSASSSSPAGSGAGSHSVSALFGGVASLLLASVIGYLL